MRTIVLTLVCLLTSPQLYPAESDNDRLVTQVQRGQARWQVPGIAVAVLRDGDITFQQGFGVAAIGSAAIDEHTLFANASTTKAMVVAGLLVLADEERLSLDHPVIRHLPELRFHEAINTADVTIRDLLSHRTGLPRTDFWTFQQRMPLAAQIGRLPLVAPAAGPRERLLYQNTMYELAGLIIERVTDKPWYEFLAERLWQPIGMHDTYGMRAQIPAGSTHVMPHMVIDGAVRQIPFDLVADQDDAAGSAWSTLHDMTLWAQFLLDGGVTQAGERLLSEAGVAEMFEPQQLSDADDFYPTVELTRPNWRTYGLGWFQQDFQGRKIDFHTGSLSGLVAIIGLDRDNRDAVIVLQNMDGAELRHALLWETFDRTPVAQRRDWVRDVFELYEKRDAERQKEWEETTAGRLAGTSPSLPLEKYLGTYQNDELGQIEFAGQAAGAGSGIPVPARVSHGGPVLRTTMTEFEATHWHLDTFLLDTAAMEYPTFIEFDVGPDGKVGGLTFYDRLFEKLQ